MAIAGTKHKIDRETKVSIQISNGIDLSKASDEIDPKNSPKMTNFVYDLHSYYPVTRPGLTAVTLDATTNDIQKIYHWVKNATTEYTVMISNNELYYLDRARTSLTAWVTATGYVIGNERKNDGYGYTCITAHTSGVDSEPGTGDDWADYWREDPVWVVQNAAGFAVDANYSAQFLPFNQRLLIAAGTKGLLYWTEPGTYGTITTGATTIHPTVITEICNRVVINSVASGGYDSIYFSKVEDETGWTFTSVGGAVLLRADYGRGVQINGFGSFSDDLIVSLSSTSWQHTVRISVAGPAYNTDTTVNWRITKFLFETGSIGHGLLQNFDRNIFFISQAGLEMITGTTDTYTELISQKIGVPINSLITGLNPIDLKIIPKLESVFLLYSGEKRVFVYHPWGAGFTELTFDSCVTSMAQRGDEVILSMGKHIYTLDNDRSTDEIVGGTATTYYSIIRTKRTETFHSATLLKGVEVDYSPLIGGTIELSYITDTDKIVLGTKTMITTAPESYLDLVEWTNDLMDCTWDFMGSSDPSDLKFYSRARGQDFTLQLRIVGRCRLNTIQFYYVELAG